MAETPDLLPITLDDMLSELRRELRMRLKVYPRAVAAGQMTQRAATRQVELLSAIVEKLESLQDSGETPE